MANIPENLRVIQGSIYVGTDGILLAPHGSRPFLIPQEKFTGFSNPKLEGCNHYLSYPSSSSVSSASRLPHRSRTSSTPAPPPSPFSWAASPASSRIRNSSGMRRPLRSPTARRSTSTCRSIHVRAGTFYLQRLRQRRPGRIVYCSGGHASVIEKGLLTRSLPILT